jgi:hypothetical protein
MSDQTHTSSAGPGLTWETLKAALETLGPGAPRADEYEIRVNEFVPRGQVVTIDGDHFAPPALLEGIPARPRNAPRWLVLIHPETARGQDLDKIAVAAIIDHQRRAAENRGSE